jgi:hypothetical protein
MILHRFSTAGKGKVEMIIMRIEKDENTTLPGLVPRWTSLEARPWLGGHAYLGRPSRQRPIQGLPDGCQAWPMDHALCHFYPLLIRPSGTIALFYTFSATSTREHFSEEKSAERYS